MISNKKTSGRSFLLDSDLNSSFCEQQNGMAVIVAIRQHKSRLLENPLCSIPARLKLSMATGEGPHLQ
jgi:hypothetical protein